MTAIPHLVVRDDDRNTSFTLTPSMMKLLIALVVLFAVGFLCIGLLLLLRSYRRRSRFSHDTIANRTPSRISHRRRGATAAPLDIRVNEKEMLVECYEPRTPDSPVPEIRITFPDEDDTGHKRQSQVMVVKISEKGSVGLEPYHEGPAPPYETSAQRMESIDLERLGGLKEKPLAAEI